MYKLSCYLNCVVLIGVFFLFQSPLYAELTEEQYLGKNVFMNNCAACHGVSGKGNGPMTEQLIKNPSNLTLLSKHNGGSFPETMIYQLIDGRRVVITDEGRTVETFHGPREMPIWGDTFRTIEGDEGAVDDLISNLLEYLKSIQSK